MTCQTRHTRTHTLTDGRLRDLLLTGCEQPLQDDEQGFSMILQQKRNCFRAVCKCTVNGIQVCQIKKLKIFSSLS